MIALLAAVAVLQIPQPMPPADLPPPDSDLWPDFLLAPPLCDRERFPCVAEVRSARAFNDRHRTWLLNELGYELDPFRQSILANWNREAHALYRAWDLLDDASRDYYPPWQRRVALKYLRDAIGEEAFYRGEMPPVVPVWRFREMSR